MPFVGLVFDLVFLVEVDDLPFRAGASGMVGRILKGISCVSGFLVRSQRVDGRA
jgi:hypothetical protein